MYKWKFYDSDKREGEMAMFGHGFVTHDYYRHRTHTCLVPFNILCRLGLALWFWLRMPQWIKFVDRARRWF